MTVSLWVADFSRRIQQLERTVGLASSGGLFTPEAFIASTRQCVTQANLWSLEDLKPDMYIGDSGPVSKLDFPFGIEGLKMHGAASKRNEIYLEGRDLIVTELSVARLRGITKTDEKQMRQDATNVLHSL